MLAKSPRIITCIILAIILQTANSAAQQNNPLINSGEKIREGLKKYEEEKYQDAIKVFGQINRSDTNYVIALKNIANSYYADSQFNKAIEYAQLGMKMFPEKFSTFTMIAANSLDNIGKSEEAQREYDKAIAYNPHDHTLYFNKGISHFNAQNNDSARAFFQQCLLINPFYGSAHYYLAGTHLREGNLVPALLGYSTYLLLSPEGNYAVNAIKILSNITKSTDDVLEVVKNKKPSAEKSFNAIQDILLSKIAIDPKYKSLVNMNDDMIKQIQVVCEKLEYKKSDPGFTMQYYVPFFEKIFNEKKFEPMVYSMFSGVDIKPIKTWNQGNRKEKEAFILMAANYLNEIRFSRVLPYTERQAATSLYVYNNDRLIGKGYYVMAKGEMQPQGNWEFFNDEGRVTLKGDFSKQAKKTGEWVSFYSNGKVKEKINYKDDLYDGTATGWFENGNKWYDETFKNGQLHGVQTIRYLNGNRKSITNFDNGKQTGEVKYFNISDQHTHTYTYKNGVLDGPYKTYHNNGKLNEESAFIKDLETGDYKSYYETGELFSSGKVSSGKRQGLWINYYKDGKTKSKSTYLDGEFTGEFSEFFENGKTSVTGNYVKKKLDGKVSYYDKDGVLYSEAVYDKGKLRELNYFDKKGNITHTNTTRKGAGLITFYSSNGNKNSEGYFDKDGLRQGKHEDYFSGGKKSIVAEWKDGELHGSYISYLPNGVKVYETTYKNGKEDGYAKAYFTNGVLKSEGWMVDGEKQQSWVYYSLAGKLYRRVYFRDDELYGYSEYFFPTQKLDYEFKYLNGWIQEMTQFDTLGNVLQENKLTDGSGKMIFRLIDGKPLSEASYTHFQLNGEKKGFFFDGSLSSKSFYKNNNLHGPYISYSFGNKVSSEGNYEDGKKMGKWKMYYSNGKLESEENYVDGKLHGIVKRYARTGSLDQVSNYKEGDLHGTVTYYGDKEEVAMVLNYEDDRVMSYQYMGADGKLIAPIPLKNYSGKISALYANGKPSVELTYYENNVDGPFKFFYSNGKVKHEGVKKSGYFDGEIKWFYPDGLLQKSGLYNHGNYHGVSKLFYANGKPEIELNYYDDDQHGINKYYDEKTGVAQIRDYYYGFIQSVK